MWFADYVTSYYGAFGIIEMRDANGKPPSKRLIKSLIPKMRRKMKEQGFEWGKGDSFDREFFCTEMLLAAGYKPPR